MSRVAVVTDSSATVPAHLVQELGIRVVPILLALDGRSFRDGVDIGTADVYRWLREGRENPTTSAPSLGDFVRAYAAVAQWASGIVSIHLSPKLSATCQAAADASQLVDGAPIRVVGCQTVAMGQGFVAIEAARAAREGADLDAVVARARAVEAKMNLLAVLDTLEYLHRGGRIGGAAAMVGSLLQVKPVLTVGNGQIGLFAKPRTKGRAVRTMLDQMAERSRGRPLHVGILHADVLDEAEALRQEIEERFECVELYVAELTPVMGAHAGPGVLGVVFYADDA
jgi:DegV family protein with EDD domain